MSKEALLAYWHYVLALPPVKTNPNFIKQCLSKPGILSHPSDAVKYLCIFCEKIFSKSEHSCFDLLGPLGSLLGWLGSCSSYGRCVNFFVT